MDIDAHTKHISKLLEFKEWAEAKIAELEAKLLGEPVAEEVEQIAEPVSEPVSDEPADDPVADTPVAVAEEEKAAE